MSELTARQRHKISPNETRLISIDMYGKLESGETCTGTPTITISPSSGVTLSNKAVNTATVTINGRSCTAGQAILCKITGQTTATNYTLTASCGTTGGTVAQTVEEICLLDCVST